MTQTPQRRLVLYKGAGCREVDFTMWSSACGDADTSPIRWTENSGGAVHVIQTHSKLVLITSTILFN